ncbi:MAG: hypothetical protein RLN76_12675 [Phycisphaeraceae bacterium]
MSRVQRLLGRARRRVWMIESLRRLGGLLVLAGLVSLLLVVVDRRTRVEILPWVHAIAPMGAMLLAGLWAWMTRPGPGALAAVLDDRLGLQDRLSTARYLSASGRGDDAFARQVMDEAEGMAAGQSLARALPVRMGLGWRWLVGVLVAVGLTFWLLPGAEFETEAQAEASVVANTPEAEAQEAEVAQLLSELRSEERDLEDVTTRDDLLRRVADLAEAGLERPELREEAEAVVSDLEQDLAAAQERSAEQAESLQNDLSRLDLPEAGAATELAEALRRGDFEEAAKALREMEQSLATEDLSEGQREQLAQQMEELSEQLEEIAQEQAERSEMAEAAVDQMLEEAGFSQEQVDQMREQGYDPEMMQRMATEQLAREIQRDGESMEQARERARQMAEQLAEAAQEQMEQGQQQGENGENTEGMSQAMRRLSEAIRQGQGEGGASAAAQERLRQMGGSQQSAEQLARDRQRALDALDQLAQGEGEGGMEPGEMSGTGGREGGYGEGNEVLGDSQSEVAGYTPELTEDLRDVRPGRVITSWGPGGGPTEAESRVRHDTTVKEARDAAERAIAEDRVPRRYHRSIQRYFEQLPEASGEGEASTP